MRQCANYAKWAVLILLVLVTILSNCRQGPPPANFHLAYSEKLDAATFLNAISENPRFNQTWLELGQTWRAKIAADSSAQAAFERWAGRGIQLAYLLSALPEDDLADVLGRFEDPESLIRDVENGLDEPAYEAIFSDLQKNYRDIPTLFSFLISNGFQEMRRRDYQSVVEATWQNVEDNLEKVDIDKFVDMLEAFTGKKVPARQPRIYVLAFSKPYSFQLSGFAVGWASETEYFEWLLAHEFLHKFNPTERNLEYQRELAENDPFYAEAWDRIYDEFIEGEEEEFVEAAARHVIVSMGLISEVRNLRSMKFLYYSQDKNRWGAPLAAVLFDELSRTEIRPGDFDYNAFITECFESGRIRAGQLEERYREAIKPVLGIAGVVIEPDERGARVARVFADYPIALAGIVPGDVLTEVNSVGVAGKNREDILDLLSGEPGTPMEVTVLRGDDSLQMRFELQ